MRNFKLFRFVEFLRENPSFFKVWLGYSQSTIGSTFTMIARTVLFYQLTNSPSAVAIFSIFSMLPSILMSPIAGCFQILFQEKKILIFSQAVNGFLVLGYIIAKDPIVFYILVFLQGILGVFFSTSFYSVIPQTVKNKDDIVTANSLNNFSENLVDVLGPSLGAIIVKFWGLIPAFIIDSITFFINAFLLSITFISEEEAVEKKVKINSVISSFYNDTKEAIKFLVNEGKYVNYILFTEFLLLLAGGTINSLLVVFTKEALHSSEVMYGYLLSAGSIGALIGSFILGNLNMKIPSYKLYFTGLIAIGIFLTMFSFANNILLGLIIFLLNGIANALLQIGFMSAIMANVLSEVRGKIFSFYILASTLGSVISLLISQKLLTIFNIQTVYRIGSIIILIISIIRFIRLQIFLKSKKEPGISIE
ncbi:MFS transporter [Dictyoglomus thermophilum]|uniref:MFS transporter n=1 Tax=Dictyoglomus thermophilum TaxID=14 RepID=UPI0011EAF655|nr:MFS transporter [Dictyoglomus thermophilum]TYT23478.1 MFS transporter [Dictyoglomus thermophilum]